MLLQTLHLHFVLHTLRANILRDNINKMLTYSNFVMPSCTLKQIRIANTCGVLSRRSLQSCKPDMVYTIVFVAAIFGKKTSGTGQAEVSSTEEKNDFGQNQTTHAELKMFQHIVVKCFCKPFGNVSHLHRFRKEQKRKHIFVQWLRNVGDPEKI